MKSRRFFIFIVLALIIGFWIYKIMYPMAKPLVEASHIETPRPPVKDPIPPKIIAKNAMPTVVPATPPPHLQIAEAPPEPPKTLDFILDEEGNAIAFGDILLGRPTEEVKQGYGKAAPPSIKLWETLDIPYHIQEPFPHPERVLEALEYFEDTNIRFVPFAGQPDAIVFQAKEGKCKSYLGKVGGHQPIWLSDNCYAAEVVHELMHAIGFIHEHSRTDRDQYVEIIWDNIEEPFKSQFTIVPDVMMKFLRGTPFDYDSIMIYRPDSFAKRPSLTTLKSKTNTPVAPVKGLSKMDIERVNKMYAR